MNRRSLASVATVGVLVAGTAALVTTNAVAEGTDDGPGIQMIGGDPASEKYTFMASLQVEQDGDPDHHRCGTALIAEQWLLTAAHCVDSGGGTPMDPALLHVNIGSNNRNEGDEFQVDKAVMHPDFLAGKDHLGDIALLHLAEAPNVPVIGLGRPPVPGTEVREVGWGQTDLDDPDSTPEELRQLDTAVLPGEKCDFGDDFSITEGDICVESPNLEAGPCFGDSGSPLLQKVHGRWVTLGVNSRSGGADCLETDHVYTSVGYYYLWVQETMRRG